MSNSAGEGSAEAAPEKADAFPLRCRVNSVFQTNMHFSSFLSIVYTVLCFSHTLHFLYFFHFLPGGPGLGTLTARQAFRPERVQ